MKYSVLLPTRNGGRFLRNCIESVLSAGHADFELVISDNANTDETPAIIRSYESHPRVKAIRLPEPVSVTENWAAAYEQSKGDYIVMMGDDDLVLPDYFTKMDRILAEYDDPDCVVYNGYSYVAPGSIKGDESSFYNPFHFRFGPDLQVESEISPEHQLRIVKDMFRWKVGIPLNMQTTIVSRRAADRLRGPLYQPPFPDHFALNALLLNGNRWVFSPKRLVVVGVSPKSFGHYVYSNDHGAGLAYLGIDADFPGHLPGSPLLNGMHIWLNLLLATYSDKLRGVKVDRAGYVRRQANAWLMQKRFGDLGWQGLRSHFADLSLMDWARLARTAVDGESWKRLTRMARRFGRAQMQIQGLERLPHIADIAEFAAWVRGPQTTPAG